MSLGHPTFVIFSFLPSTMKVWWEIVWGKFNAVRTCTSQPHHTDRSICTSTGRKVFIISCSQYYVLVTCESCNIFLQNSRISMTGTIICSLTKLWHVSYQSPLEIALFVWEIRLGLGNEWHLGFMSSDATQVLCVYMKESYNMFWKSYFFFFN